MSFPLSDWIDDHSGVPHDMGHSGMLGQLRSTPRWVRHPAAGNEQTLRRVLARRHHVAPERLFLTHGASEANALILQFVRAETQRTSARAPRCFVSTPEYPPIPDVATLTGFRMVRGPGSADLVALSNPHNPTGTHRPASQIRGLAKETGEVLVDETFREFTTAKSVAAGSPRGIWATGTFTKAWGADAIRVGWAIAPPERSDSFETFHGLLLDGLPTASVGAALSLLRHEKEILGETRGIFSANVRALRASIPEAPALQGPVWFDRVRRGMDGDRFAWECLAGGVLVCPGSFFGDRSGVRVGLTGRDFPRSLVAYLRVRARAGRRR